LRRSIARFRSSQEQPRDQLVSERISNRTYLRYGEEPAALCACRVPEKNTKEMGAMGLFTEDIKTMNDLFVHQLQTSIMPRSSS
jgi:hypothetical protein